HTMNYGAKGLVETRKILAETGIRYTGVGEIEIIVSNGVTFGFLGFDKSQIPKPVLTQAEKELISEANIKVDVLIVSMHWGVEYQDYANSGQRDLAKEIVDLGADVIIGHHPHVVQDYEEIAGVPVFYSLGNFVFDQMWSEKTKKGKLVKIVFENTQIVGIKEYNTYIEKIGQPIIVSDATLN
ncbi:MAG: CapA family protein, partial [Patescibacteria group bacterium]|nr:CapA family protein [Patescibacteria group bacterium]